jgi:hypothetical protein
MNNTDLSCETTSDPIVQLEFITFCYDIGRIAVEDLLKAFALLYSSLEYYNNTFKFTIYTNLTDIKYQNYFNSFNNVSLIVRDFPKINNCPWNGLWYSLSFYKPFVLKEHMELGESPIWIDLDTLICSNLNFLNKYDNFFIKICKNKNNKNLHVVDDIHIDYNQYLQGNFFKFNKKILDTYFEVLNNNKDKGFTYDSQGIINYINYKKYTDMTILSDIYPNKLFGTEIATANGEELPYPRFLKSNIYKKDDKIYSSVNNDNQILIFSFHFHSLVESLNDNFNYLDDQQFKQWCKSLLLNYHKHKSRKLSIVMTYWNRKNELNFTLETISKSKYLNKEIIIIDDCSDNEHRLEDFIKNFNLDIKLIRIEPEEKGNIVNPCFAYNKGFDLATGEIIIIQNSECIHVGDICDLVNSNLSDDNYLSFSCISSPSFDYNNELYEEFHKNNDKTYDKNILEYCQKTIFPITERWYNHPIIKPTDYHFLTAITKNNLTKLGGFDQRYRYRASFDDDDLIQRIRYILKLNVINYDPNIYPYAIHLMHARCGKFTVGWNYDVYVNRMNELGIPVKLFV